MTQLAVDVVPPAGTISDRARQENPMLGFTLYEQIRCDESSIGQMHPWSTALRY
jgi:hypothetical protein